MHSFALLSKLRHRGLLRRSVAGLAAVPVVVLILVQGPVWTVTNFFWVDLAIGPAVAMLLAAVATRRPKPFVRLLDTAPVRSLGTFSYSLYLIHAPIVVAIDRTLVAPHVAPGLPEFFVTLAIAVPVSVVGARVFAAFFEIPFQRYRSWAALRAAVQARVDRLRGVQPHLPTAPAAPIVESAPVVEPASVSEG